MKNGFSSPSLEAVIHHPFIINLIENVLYTYGTCQLNYELMLFRSNLK